jgi:3-deoxy-D-manno-octulosonic-acid transferase
MYFVYSLLLTIGVIALMPRFLFGALRHRKYITGLSERLGKVPTVKADGRPVVWLHCVSVGETEAARPLVHALRNRFPSHALIISTTTLTGQAFARRAFAEQVAAIFYFPIDWAWTVRRVLSALNPSAVLIMETELWPRLFRECHRREIPVALVNGRISEKSFRGYRIPRRFIRRVVNDLTIALMQSDPDAERLRGLGFPNERIFVSGNLKFDSAEMNGNEELTIALRDRFGFDGTSQLIVAASTHEPEERVICEALQSLVSSPDARVRLVIAPRHPERFDDVAALLRGSGQTWARRSDLAKESDKDCEVILLDSIGELRAVYPVADLVFVGGSITPHGGHNMLEPAAAGVCVVTGPHTQNFGAITKALLDNHALVQLPELSLEETKQHLVSVLSELLSDDERRRELAERARAVCEQNRGATERTIEMLADILAPKERTPESFHFSTRSAVASK